VKRPEPAKPKLIVVGSFPEKSWEGKHSEIMAFLTDVAYDDGTPRELSTISLFVEDGMFKAALNDKDMRRSLYVTAESMLGALGALEATLLRGGGDWRPWNKATKKK